MAQAQMSLNQEHTQTQKLLQIIEGKLKCNLKNRGKYDEILEHDVNEPQKEEFKTKQALTLSYHYLVFSAKDINLKDRDVVLISVSVTVAITSVVIFIYCRMKAKDNRHECSNGHNEETVELKSLENR